MAETLPLTPGQERVWLSEQRHPGTASNHLVGCYRLEGPLDPDALAEAFRRVTVRHEALRAGFAETGGTAFATVCHDLTPEVEVVAADGFADAYALAVEAAKRPFHLAQPGLMRALLCRYGSQSHLLTIIVHHLVADGTAASVLARDVAQAYHAARQGRPWEPAPLAMSYLDHVSEETALHGDEAVHAGLDYWQRELAGAPLMVDIATDLSRPARRSDLTHSHVHVLAGDDLFHLRRFARACRCSPTVVLAAVWAVMLSRLSGQDDIVFGMAVSRRDRPETAGLVASLMNVIPLRIRLAPEVTLGQAVRLVREKLLHGLAHQDVPLQRIIDRLGPERIPGLAPVVHVLFNQDAAGAGVTWDGVRAEPVDLPVPAGMDLDVELSVVSPVDHTKVRLAVRCAADLFVTATSQGLVGQFVALLRDGLARPEVTIEELDLIGAPERAALERFSTGPAPGGGGMATPAAIERRMQESPGAVAVVAGERAVTYGELHRRVVAVAARLQGVGVRAGDIVAVHSHRSEAVLVGMLAAWWRRAAYLPVDPAYPRRRVEFLLRDSAAVAVLSTIDVADGLPADLAVPVVPLDDVALEAAPPSGGVREETDPADPAYVIYTSGSTGVPKGVRISHRSLANLLDAVIRETGMDAGTVMLHSTSPSFDIAAVELFGPLWTGGRLVVAAPGEEVDPPRLADLISQHGVTMVQATPVTWAQLTEVLGAAVRLRQAICAGEPLTQELARRICRHAEAVWNGYGPSETTIYSIWHRVDPDAADVMTPIGRPVAGTAAHVVDERLRRQPLGVPGELLLAGLGVAQGYHHRPELSAQQFLDNPFGDGRAYRTGDVVRLRHDGTFEFQGRRDNQVKIRGQRIELDEIAEVLRRHPEVHDATVAVRRDRQGEPHLVAYVVPARGRLASPEGPASPEREDDD
jgi:amino acid adenylation domain-containing protein